jgi:hypothetical protein
MNSLMKREAQREKGVRSKKRWWEEEGKPEPSSSRLCG